MSDRVRFHPQVAADLAEAMAWYDERSPGLGERFRDEVDSRFNAVSESPERFPLAFDDTDLRFARARRFPYLVLFRIRDKIVEVLGVFHTASDPVKWRRRATQG